MPESIYTVELVADWRRPNTSLADFEAYRADAPRDLLNKAGIRTIEIEGQVAPTQDELVETALDMGLYSGVGEDDLDLAAARKAIDANRYLSATWEGTATFEMEVYATSQRRALRYADERLDKALYGDGHGEGVIEWCEAPEVTVR